MNSKFQSMDNRRRMENPLIAGETIPLIPSIFQHKTLIPRYIFQNKLGSYQISIDYISKFITNHQPQTDKSLDEYVIFYTQLKNKLSLVGKELTNTVLFDNMNKNNETNGAGEPIRCWKDVVSWFKKITSTDQLKIHYSYDIYDIKKLTKIILNQEKLEYCSKIIQTAGSTKKREDGWIAELLTRNIQSKRNTVRQYIQLLSILHALNIILLILHS